MSRGKARRPIPMRLLLGRLVWMTAAGDVRHEAQISDDRA